MDGDRTTAETTGSVAPTQTQGELDRIQTHVVDVLKTCYDPEIPVDIYELGLIYRVDVADGGSVAVDMTLTSPACPVAGTLPREVEMKVGRVEGVSAVRVDLVWDPPWNPDRMSDAAKLKLGFL